MSDQDPEIEIEIPEVEFVASGADDEERESNLELVEPSPGYPTTCILVADAIVRRADTVVLDYSAQIVKIRFQAGRNQTAGWHELPREATAPKR